MNRDRLIRHFVDALYVNDNRISKGNVSCQEIPSIIFPAIETFDGVAYRIESWAMK
jgi:excinuclease ABC subunit B